MSILLDDAESLALDEAVSDVIKKNSGYASLSSVAKETETDPEVLRTYFANHSDQFRKSLIRAKDGGEVYLLNTPLSALTDAWNAFRDLNGKKY